MRLPKMYAQKTEKGSIDLTLSENPLACSPLVVKTLRSMTADEIRSYPSERTLRKAIARRFNISSDAIVLGCGSEQLIKLVAQTFLTTGTTALIQQGSFPVFTRECTLAGARVKFLPIENMSKSANAKLIILCNPNNPTGETVPMSIIADIVDTNTSSIVIVDEANGDFMDSSFMRAATQCSNCIVLRSFSKAFGLAGLRIGFAVASPPLLRTLRASQQIFPVSTVSCLLAATALRDQEFVERTQRFVDREREFLCRELRKRKLSTSSSITFNLFIETNAATDIIKELSRRGVAVVPGSSFPGLTRPGFRISVKDKRTNRLFLQKLDQALASLSNNKLPPPKEGG